MRADFQQTVLAAFSVPRSGMGQQVWFQGRSGQPTKRCILDAANSAKLPSEPYIPPGPSGRFFRGLLNTKKRIRNWTAGLVLGGLTLMASAPLMITAKIQATKAPYGAETITENLPYPVRDAVHSLEIERLIANLLVFFTAVGALVGMRGKQKEVQETLDLMKHWEDGLVIETSLDPAEQAAERHLKQRFEQKVSDLYTRLKPMYAKSFPDQEVVDRLFRYLGTQYLRAHDLSQGVPDENEPRLTKRTFYQAALTMAELATLRGELFEALQFSENPEALEGQEFRPELARVAALVHTRVGQEADRQRELFRERESLRRTLEQHESKACPLVLEYDEKIRIAHRLEAVEAEMKNPPPLVKEHELEAFGLLLSLEALAAQQEIRPESALEAPAESSPSVDTLVAEVEGVLQQLADETSGGARQQRTHA